jgi:hypothetical protein
MDLSTISMDQEAAKKAFAEYRGAFMAERNRIDAELMRGYKALAEGKQLIRLTETITAGGVDDLGRPKMAIARADERDITFSRSSRGNVEFTPGWLRSGRQVRARDRTFTFPDGTLPQMDSGWISTGTWIAIVPVIPPHLRPPRVSIENFHVLWETVWTKPARTRAPRDPALLRHIGGDLWAVLAVWDLTELERAVLEMRPQ